MPSASVNGSEVKLVGLTTPSTTSYFRSRSSTTPASACGSNGPGVVHGLMQWLMTRVSLGVPAVVHDPFITASGMLLPVVALGWLNLKKSLAASLPLDLK